MVELALLLPVMVFGLIGAADLARAYALQLAVQNGARAGAEAYAIDYAKNQAQAITRARTEMSQTPGLNSANATINRELAILRRAFVLAMHDGQLFTRPHFPTLKENAPRAGFFDDAQFEAVRRYLPEELRGVVTFAFITGWRIRSEVLAMTWRQVDFKAGTVRLDPGKTKTGEARVFPFTRELRDLLDEQREHVREVERRLGKVVPHVWCWMESRRSRVPGAPIRDFRGAWKVACRAAGVPGRVPHDFRRSAIRNMVQRGVPERVAMMLAGHRTRTVFDRYAIVSHADLTAAVGKLDGTGAADSKAKAGAKTTPSA